MLKLVICEKPSQAHAYAAVLDARKRKDGYFEGGGWVVSWCFGHLVELAPAGVYGEQYKRWNRDMLPILPVHWQYTASKDKSGQLSILRGLIDRADVGSIVCATDAGREGELIFRLVYDYCKCKNRWSGYGYRRWRNVPSERASLPYAPPPIITRSTAPRSAALVRTGWSG